MKIFWAWQSDLPGKISRHFVRDALKAAIEELRQTPDIEEPNDEARRYDLHLDSDRQGIPGSPDLAGAIFDEIDACMVFVGDVAPVGQVPTTTGQQDATAVARRLMNPNVAIELGYAIARHTDKRLLMILNTAYGGRDDLPFGVRHKAGPMTYELRAVASSTQLRSEQARLSAVLALDLGASGFIPKSSGTATIIEAVETVLAGGVWTPPWAHWELPADPEIAAIARRAASLTAQQIRVLMMLKEGLLNKQIAPALTVSGATVKAHVSAILLKLGVASRTQAVIAASKFKGL